MRASNDISILKIKTVKGYYISPATAMVYTKIYEYHSIDVNVCVCKTIRRL